MDEREKEQTQDILSGNGGFLPIKHIFNTNIMGTTYKIKVINDKNDFLTFEGLMRPKEKDILLLDKYEHIEDLKKTLLHELLHAYFHECALTCYSNDEILISWLEQNYFKIVQTLNNILYQIFKR